MGSFVSMKAGGLEFAAGARSTNVLAKPRLWLERQDLDLAEIRDSASSRSVRLTGRAVSHARVGGRNSPRELARLVLGEFHVLILIKGSRIPNFHGAFSGGIEGYQRREFTRRS
jgi:hypothetical protein